MVPRTGKSPNFASLKLMPIAKCGDSKLLVEAMKSYPKVEDVNTSGICAWKGRNHLELLNKNLDHHQVLIETPIDLTE